MDKATRRLIIDWSVCAIALLAVGPLAGAAAATARSPQGAPDTTALTAAAPLSALVMAILALALAGVWGIIVRPLAGQRMALACAGMVLLWSARQFGRPEAILRESATASTLTRLSVEGALVALGALVIALLIARTPKRDDQHEHRAAPGPVLALGALSILLMVAVGGLTALIVARTGLFGQTIAAAIAAGVVGAATARTVAHAVPLWVLFVGGIALAAAGPIVAQVMAGSEIRPHLYAGDLFPLALIAPFDWAAGLLIGVPVGDAWASSVVERHDPALAHTKS